MRAALIKFFALGTFALLFICADPFAAQDPAAFSIPVLGHILDVDRHAIRPIVGIPGNSRIGPAIDFGLPIARVTFLPDRMHALAVSSEAAEVLVLNLEATERTFRLTGIPSNLDAIQASRDGTTAAFYYASTSTILVVGGLPQKPVLKTTIDLSFERSALTRFVISDDAELVLMVFAGEKSDIVYSSSQTVKARFITTAEKISDATFVGPDAVFADSSANQIVVIRDVRYQASPALVADSSQGVRRPIALAVSSRSEIYVGNSDSGSVLVLDENGHYLRTVVCGCTIGNLSPLGDSVFRLTERLDVPISILDGRSQAEQILFIPAMSGVPAGGAQ